MFDLEDLLQPGVEDDGAEWALPPLASNLEHVLEGEESSFQAFPDWTEPRTKRLRGNSLSINNFYEQSNSGFTCASKNSTQEFPVATSHPFRTANQIQPHPSTSTTRKPKVSDDQVKQRKCSREKQRRAELAQVYSNLAKRLQLPVRTEKIQLIKSADSKITKLQDQVAHLQNQLAMMTILPHLGKESTDQAKNKLFSAPEKKTDKCGAICVPIKPREDEVPHKSNTLTEMKSLVQKVENLYKMHLANEGEDDDDDEVTVSQCA